MNEQRAIVSRPRVAAIAAACLVLALVFWLYQPEQAMIYGSFLRVGVMMTVFWLALPGRGREAAWARISPWALVGIVVAAILLPRFKQVIIPLIIVVAVAAIFLRPRRKSGPPRQQHEASRRAGNEEARSTKSEA